MKGLQKFTPEYLEMCRSMKSEQIVKFLDEFRMIHGEKILSGESKLISIKIPASLLTAFRNKCDRMKVPYQTQMKVLMMEWLRIL